MILGATQELKGAKLDARLSVLLEFSDSRILDQVTPSLSSACGTQASAEANEQVSLLTLPNNRNDVIAAVRRKFETDVFSGRDNRYRN